MSTQQNTGRFSEKRKLLSSIWLFDGQPAQTIEQFAQYTRIKACHPNETIFRKGEPGTSMMVVAEGRVKIRSAFWDGREILLNIIDRGEVFGEIALLDGGERTADAVAMDKSVLFVLERRDMLRLIQNTPEIGVRLLSVLCERIRRTSGQVEDLLFLAHPTRLAKALLWLARRYGHESSDGVALEIRLSQRELGTMVGVRREAMNRQLAIWREAGLIAVERGLITIFDVEAFETMAEALPD